MVLVSVLLCFVLLCLFDVPGWVVCYRPPIVSGDEFIPVHSRKLRKAQTRQEPRAAPAPSHQPPATSHQALQGSFSHINIVRPNCLGSSSQFPHHHLPYYRLRQIRICLFCLYIHNMRFGQGFASKQEVELYLQVTRYFGHFPPAE